MLAFPRCHDEQSDDQNEACTNTVQHEYNERLCGAISCEAETDQLLVV